MRVGRVLEGIGLAAGAYGIIAADAVGPLGQAATWAMLVAIFAVTAGHTLTAQARMRKRARKAARRLGKVGRGELRRINERCGEAR